MTDQEAVEPQVAHELRGMARYYKAKADRLQSQVDRIGTAYCQAETDHDFSEQVFEILQENE